MSLLMDALKKAELAKRQGQSEGAAASTETNVQSGLALELVADEKKTGSEAPKTTAGDASAAASLPHLPSHLEELDAQFLAEAQQAASARLRAPPPVPPPPVREPLTDLPAAADTPRNAAPERPRQPSSAQNAPQNRSAAQNLFSAKQADKPPARKSFAITVGVITVLSVCGIGGYFWWQLQPKSMTVANRAPMATLPVAASTPATMPPPVSAAAAPAPAPAGSPPAPIAGVAGVAGVAGAARPPTQTTPQTTPVADDKDDDSAPAAAAAQTRGRRAIPVAAVPPEPDSPIRVTKAPLKVNPALIRGFDAFNRGDLAAAQTEYERAQKSDPRNTDVLHGLAAIALRQGRADQAEQLYRRIAEADPQDTVALAALINMRGQVDPGSAESKLKSLAAAQPELAAPHFSLGNLYARHGRWNDAQQAYFKAYSAEPDNPDILYNLAISLEHLRQNKLAAQYYGQAVAAAQTRPAGFDKTQATARLNALQP